MPTPAPTPEVVDVEAGKRGVPVISPSPVYNSRTRHVYQLPADRTKAVDSYICCSQCPSLEQWSGLFLCHPDLELQILVRSQTQIMFVKSKQASRAKLDVEMVLGPFVYLLV